MDVDVGKFTATVHWPKCVIFFSLRSVFVFDRQDVVTLDYAFLCGLLFESVSCSVCVCPAAATSK